jgi:DMSO/TMAO reductase YedYZ molybdopterin-dependent catalytic subunit
VTIILAALLPLHLAFGLTYPPLSVANYIIETSDANIALALMEWLGPYSLASAILGGVMLIASLGLIDGLIYRGIIARFGEQTSGIAIIVTCIAMPILVQVIFGLSVVETQPLLLTGILIGWIAREDTKYGRVNISRRQLLGRLAIFSIGGVALGVIKGIPTVISEMAQTQGQTIRKLFDFTTPAARVDGFDIKGLAPEITPVENFYVMRKFPTPIPEIPADWTLRIDGLVQTPITLTLTDLEAMPRTDEMVTRQCISNPVGGTMISTALMSGVPLKTLLDQAGVLDTATEVVFYGRDGYSESINLAYGREYGLITYAMNGQTLPAVHGAPVRMEMIGLYGFKSLKWLDRIEVVDQHYVAIWEEQGWTANPIVKTMSRVDTIQMMDDGMVAAGVAFAGTRSISQVEVKINDGEWQEATLNTPQLSEQTWVQWRAESPSRGDVTVTVRAVDGEGKVQIEDEQAQKPDGASGLHSRQVKL